MQSLADLCREGPLFQQSAEGIHSRKSVMQELSAQLQNWRIHLPPAIAWDEDSQEDVTMFDPDRDIYREAITPIDPAITGMIDSKAILNAALRTRYKYAQYIIWRPYIYQILHFPLDSAQHEYECCRRALKVRGYKTEKTLPSLLLMSNPAGLHSVATHLCNFPATTTTSSSSL